MISRASSFRYIAPWCSAIRTISVVRMMRLPSIAFSPVAQRIHSLTWKMQLIALGSRMRKLRRWLFFRALRTVYSIRR